MTKSRDKHSELKRPIEIATSSPFHIHSSL